MKKLIALLLALAMIIGLVACGNPNAETPEEPDNTPVAPEQNDDPVVDPEPSEDEPVNTNPVYTVKIVDEGGNPVVGVMVQICQGETCLPGPLSDENGTVTFQVAEADYKVSFLGGVPAGYEYTTEETEFYFEDGSYEVTIVLKAVA